MNEKFARCWEQTCSVAAAWLTVVVRQLKFLPFVVHALTVQSEQPAVIWRITSQWLMLYYLGLFFNRRTSSRQTFGNGQKLSIKSFAIYFCPILLISLGKARLLYHKLGVRLPMCLTPLLTCESINDFSWNLMLILLLLEPWWCRWPQSISSPPWEPQISPRQWGRATVWWRTVIAEEFGCKREQKRSRSPHLISRAYSVVKRPYDARSITRGINDVS